MNITTFVQTIKLDMYAIFKTSHSYLAAVLLILLIGVVGYMVFNKLNKKPFDASKLKIALMGLILTHIQFLLGLILYFISPMGFKNLSGATMKDSFARLQAVEHPMMMLIAVVLVTIGYSKAKKQMGTDKAYNSVLIFYILGIICMLSRIPWQVWMK